MATFAKALFFAALGLLLGVLAFKFWAGAESQKNEARIARAEQQQQQAISRLTEIESAHDLVNIDVKYRKRSLPSVRSCRNTKSRIDCSSRVSELQIPRVQVRSRSTDAALIAKIGRIETDLKAAENTIEQAGDNQQELSWLATLVDQYFKHALSLIFLLISAWILLSRKYDEQSSKWAMGTLGTILGSWLGT